MTPRSPTAEALARLLRHRPAVAGLVVVTLIALAGLLAPVLARTAIGLSPAEQHTALAFAPPGAQDIGLDHRAYDGDSTGFAAVDLDGDGLLRCTRPAVPALLQAPDQAATIWRQTLTESGLSPAKGVWPPGTRLSQPLLVAGLTAPLQCPELDQLARLERLFAFALAHLDVQTAGQPARAGVRQPDGILQPDEWPAAPEPIEDLWASTPGLGTLAQQLGWLGPAGFARLDADHNGQVTQHELLAQTRATRFDPEHLLATADANLDLQISAEEFPGLPAMRTFWLGTDQKGRDLLVRLLYGARVSLAIGLLATLVSVLIGVSYGAIAGYLGGRADSWMMRAVDVLYGLPFLFVVILLLVVAGRSLINLFVALGAVSWLSMARIVRGQVLSWKQRDFVLAARAVGVSRTRILLRHILPNCLGPVLVYATLSIPAVILEEAFLSFLGLGVQPPDASWGTLLSEGARLLQDRPWLLLYPAGMLAVTLFSLNFLGDGLRDALDPRAD